DDRLGLAQRQRASSRAHDQSTDSDLPGWFGNVSLDYSGTKPEGVSWGWRRREAFTGLGSQSNPSTSLALAGVSKVVTELNGQPASGNGHGTHALEVHHGDQVTYQITVTGQPPGGSSKGTVTDNFPQHMSFVSANPPTFVEDGSHTKGSWNNVDFSANGGV